MHNKTKELSRIQAFLLQGVLPIVILGLLLPVGLVAMFLAFHKVSVAQSVNHGELYLAAGNAAFTGCLVLISCRQDRAMDAVIAALFVVALLVVPCYAAWAYFSVEALLGQDYPTAVATTGGVAAIGMASAVSLVLVSLSYVKS